jgi:hypothetical protein
MKNILKSGYYWIKLDKSTGLRYPFLCEMQNLYNDILVLEAVR